MKMDCDNYIGITSDFLCIAPPQFLYYTYDKDGGIVDSIYTPPVTNAIGCCSINKPNSTAKWYCLLDNICQILDCSDPKRVGVN
jgi:hypothetical protein